MTSDDAAKDEVTRAEDARQRSRQIAAAEESADHHREDDEVDPEALSPDIDAAYLNRPGRHNHESDDAAAYSRHRSRRYGPGR